MLRNIAENLKLYLENIFVIKNTETVKRQSSPIYSIKVQMKKKTKSVK